MNERNVIVGANAVCIRGEEILDLLFLEGNGSVQGNQEER